MLKNRLNHVLRSYWPALTCALAGGAVFHYFGNATRGYINTASLFAWWFTQWLDENAELQHAWILLVLAIWIYWHNLQISGPTENKKDRRTVSLATGAMCFALLLHGLGFQMQQARISIVALLIFGWGVLGFAGGSRWARAAFFPIGLMVFTIPFGFLDSTSFWMRLWVVDASYAFAKLVHLDVVRSGTQLFSAKGGYQYDVASACSGIRSLQALMALSLVAGYLRLRSTKGRIIVFLVGFPMVYLGNIIRIVAILTAAGWAGQKAGERVHDVSGFIVFAIVLAAVLGVVALLKRLKPEWAAVESMDTETGMQGKTVPATNDLNRGAPKWEPVLIVLFIIINLSLWLGWLGSHAAVSRCGLALSADGINPAELPSFIGDAWIGRRQEVSAVERQILPPDTGYSRRVYHSLEQPGRTVFMSIVLSGRDRSSIHRPELCLVGQGWSIEGTFEHSFAGIAYTGHSFPSTILRVRRQVPGAKTSTPELVAYCFFGADRAVATQFDRMWLDAWSRLSGKPQRWAYILLQTDAGDGEGKAIARIQAIMDGTLPELLSPANEHTGQSGLR